MIRLAAGAAVPLLNVRGAYVFWDDFRGCLHRKVLLTTVLCCSRTEMSLERVYLPG